MSSQTYDSANSALEHIHEAHSDCPGPDVYRVPSDDPCYIWVKTTCQDYRSVRYSNMGRIVDAFVIELENVMQRAKSLQLAVAGTDSAVDTPPLPSSLMRAFQHIVLAHVLLAKRLSLKNRWVEGVPDGLRPKVIEVNDHASRCLPQAGHSLDLARKDIMLLGTASSTGAGVNLESIGGEFLVAVIVGSLQKRGLNSESRPSAMLELYQRYAAQLQFQARQNPKRRLFLDIQALQDELGAFQNIAKAQQNLLTDYLKLSSPTLSPHASATRRSVFNVEKRYIEKLQQELRERDAKLDILQDRMRILRDRVKQSIEILEEGHGKAIRVFTVVTLFFLPL